MAPSSRRTLDSPEGEFTVLKAARLSDEAPGVKPPQPPADHAAPTAAVGAPSAGAYARADWPARQDVVMAETNPARCVEPNPPPPPHAHHTSPPAESGGEQNGSEESPSSAASADDDEDLGRGSAHGREQRRKRRRSRSVQRPVAPGAASGASVDIRELVRKGRPQRHIGDYRTAWHEDIAGSGREWRQQPGRRMEMWAHRLDLTLRTYLEPIPSCHQFLEGIPHKNDKAEYAGQLWDVVRAMGSKKMHYLAKLGKALWPVRGPWPRAPFSNAYPDAVFGEGYNALQPWAFQRTKELSNAKSDYHYVRHILNKHDGEVRHWGPREWVPVPPGVDITHSRFWSYQFCKTPAVRAHLERGEQITSEGKIPDSIIEWVLAAEKGETRLLKRVPGADPASGGTWYIMSGQYVTLAELFEIGCQLCSCHYLYRVYLAQPLFLSKKKHSMSSKPEATMRRNARSPRWQQDGCRGLPSPTS